jgi:nucleoside phosphorylase
MSGRSGALAIAVLAAQVEEVAPLLARLGARYDGADAVARHWRSDLDGVAVAVSGMGRRRARAAAGALLDRSRASRLIVAGVGGALSPDLELGALVVAETVIADDGPPLRTDARGARAAIAAGARAGTVITVDRMVATVADRSALRVLVSGSVGEGPLVVDMESYDAVAEASARGVPATVLRAVSDTYAEDLPSFLEQCRRPDGDLDRRRVVLHALVRPGSIPALYELRRRVRTGAAALAELVARLAPALGSPPGSG